MKKLLLGLLVGACTFVSCKKDSSAPSAPGSTSKVSDWSKLCDVANPENRYDEAGSEHNRLVAACEASATKDMSLDEVYALTDEVLKKEGMDPGRGSAAFASPLLKSMETEEGLKEYISAMEISDAQKEELNNLTEIMGKYDGTNLCEVIAAIKEFEKKIMDRYKGSDMEAVLIASSIGRYSLAYWHERVSADGGDPKLFKTTKGFWKKLFVGVCDAIGGAAGASGGVAGAVVGAIGASNGAATLWDVFAK